MTLEIKKETKCNGDAFYYIYKDGKYQSSCSFYINTDPEKALARAKEAFELLKSGKSETVEIILSEEI